MERLFTTALGLSGPWFVSHLELDQDFKVLRIDIAFKKGSRFSHAQQDNLTVYDTHKDSGRLLNFFEFKTILTARVPREKTFQGKKYKVQVPLRRVGSGITLLMEAQLLLMSRSMPGAEVSRLTNVTQPRIWHLIRAHAKALQ